MKKFFTLVFLLFLSFAFCEGTRYGYISALTSNVGDEIQSIAAKRFLPKKAIAIDRDTIHEFSNDVKIKTLISGWFMHTKEGGFWERQDRAFPEKSWPPSPSIDPLLISIHITGTAFSSIFSEEGIQYLKTHGPVGARDLFTLSELQKRGIPSYFSGCLTLTLDNPCKKRNDIIYIVDVDDRACVEAIKANAKSKVVVMSHGKSLMLLLDSERRMKYAEKILNLYRKAKCVITERLHVALPCLAFETPVIYVGGTKNEKGERYGFDPRLSGLIELLRNRTRSEIASGNFDFDVNNPPANSKAYLKIRENLIKRVSDWVIDYKSN